MLTRDNFAAGFLRIASSVRALSASDGDTDRAFVFGLLALLVGLGVPVGTWLTAFLAIIVALLVVTILNRARRALAETPAKG
jgi:hypothetical protein